MVVSNQTAEVEEAVKWALDFHLINHPLDCPICDQAGECGLQEQYMEFGRYEPEMSERKVKKKKVVDLGEKIVLDSERCILCSRCVRFTDEVTKTNELGIVQRGDRSEISTMGKKLENNYSLNTVDICPVGALTSKDFRFQQRAWLLKESSSICPGCSTGCNIKVSHNEKGVFRARPEGNSRVNGYWMCDEGRRMAISIDKKNRLLQAFKYSSSGEEELAAGAAAKEVGELIHNQLQEKGSRGLGLVLTGQYTCEEYQSSLEFFHGRLGSDQVFHWLNNSDKFEEFDGLLLRGDRNPNTGGLIQQLEGLKLNKTWEALESELMNKEIQILIVAGPEVQEVFPDLKNKMNLFARVKNLIWLTTHPVDGFDQLAVPEEGAFYQIPVKSFFEKSGTWVNHQGVNQELKARANIVSGALTLDQIITLWAGGEIRPSLRSKKRSVSNELIKERGNWL